MHADSHRSHQIMFSIWNELYLLCCNLIWLELVDINHILADFGLFPEDALHFHCKGDARERVRVFGDLERECVLIMNKRFHIDVELVLLPTAEPDTHRDLVGGRDTLVEADLAHANVDDHL